MTPSCPWCGKRSSVVRLVRIIAGKEWECEDCRLVLSGTVNEARACTEQRAIARQIAEMNARQDPAPHQEELPTDAA